MTEETRGAWDPENDRPTPLWEDFGQFVHERCNSAIRGMRQDPAYRKAREKYSSRRDELWKKIEEKVGFELLDAFEGTCAEEAGRNEEACYLQGLRDGLELAQKLWRRNGGGEPDGAASE